MRTIFNKQSAALLPTLIASVSLIYSATAQAELSIGALAGTAGYTTQVRGDALYSYGGTYYSYPQDINNNQGAIGVVARYVFPVKYDIFLGAETGYVYLGTDVTRSRNNDYIGAATTPVWVENFTTKSTGLVLLNAVAGLQLSPSLKFSIFGGPAWLNTNYTANDFFDNFSRSLGSSYQLTAAVGTEVDWSFCHSWSAGMRFDYVFPTSTRTISTGFGGGNLVNPLTAKSSLTLFTLNVRYLIPGT